MTKNKLNKLTIRFYNTLTTDELNDLQDYLEYEAKNWLIRHNKI